MQACCLPFRQTSRAPPATTRLSAAGAGGILIGGGGGDILQAGSGSQILVGGPGGAGLPSGNHDITVSVTAAPVSSAPVNPATPNGIVGQPIALTIDPSLLTAIKADASLSLTITGLPSNATLALGGIALTAQNGRATITQAQLAQIASLTLTASAVESFTLHTVGTTNEGGQFTGGADGDTFVLGAHDGAEAITDFTTSQVNVSNHDVINLADIPQVQSFADLVSSGYLTQDGAGNAVLDFTSIAGLSTVVKLQGVNKNTLNGADFVFAQTAPPDDTSTVITNSPIGTEFILDQAAPILLSNGQVSFGSAPGAYGTLTQDLSAGTSQLALNSGLDNVSYPYVVASTTDGTVNTFTSVVGSTLNVAAGNFAITQGTGSGENAGTLEVSGTGTLNLSGDFQNAGSVEVVAGTLNFSNAHLTGGAVIVTGNGTFNASGLSSITDAIVTNSGAFDVGSGTLTIDPTTIDNTGGTITVDGTGTLALTGGDIVDNGALDNAGQITVTGSSNVIKNEDGSASVGEGSNKFTNTGTLQVADGGELTLSADSVDNDGGQIKVDAGGVGSTSASTRVAVRTAGTAASGTGGDRSAVTTWSRSTARSRRRAAATRCPISPAATSPAMAPSRWRAAPRCRWMPTR